MAERRMFAKTIIDSDVFLDMPLTTQALYFHLSMRADDDGFVNNPKKIQKMVGASDDDLTILKAKNFLIPLQMELLLSNIGKFTTISEMTVTKKRLIRKKKQCSKSKKTMLIPSKMMLVYQMSTKWIPNVYQMDTVWIHRLG